MPLMGAGVGRGSHAYGWGLLMASNQQNKKGTFEGLEDHENVTSIFPAHFGPKASLLWSQV